MLTVKAFNQEKALVRVVWAQSVIVKTSPVAMVRLQLQCRLVLGWWRCVMPPLGQGCNLKTIPASKYPTSA